MKKTIKLMSLCLFVALGFTSCEPAEDDIRPEPRELGGYAYLSDRTISSFDQNEDLNINLFLAEGVEAESVEIIQDGEVLGSATVSGETASFNASILGDLEAGDSFPVRVRTTLSNGNVAEDPFTIAVVDALTLDEIPENARFMDTTANILSYSTFADYATIDQVSLYFRSNLDDEYSLIADDLDVAEGEIDLGDFDYEAMNVTPGDTIFYRFVAASGDMSEEALAIIPVVAQEFGPGTMATLSNDPTMDSFSLATGEYVPNEEAEMLFMSPLGFQTEMGIDFVTATVPDDMTATEFVEETDLMEAEDIYMNGTPMTSVEDVEAGDVFIYRVVRQNEDGEDMVFYGIMRIGDVTVTNASEESFEFVYAEGNIIRE